MLEALKSLLDRLGSEAYSPLAILIELVLIGISVNWCAGVLQGTRGTRLLRGLIIILVVVTLVLRLASVNQDWRRLELLYQYFVFGLAFVALVAFQPELRRAFIRAGEVSLFRRSSGASAPIAALVESAKFLSRNRYGALIAIQRDVGLKNWAENGTPLSAEVSANLLNTIFFPNSPLHDLGVIVDGDRVIAANCQFPQCESGEIDASLGSRHRAAVGLSQESDALVLVVSEETGTISLADRGKLLRFLSLDDLTQELVARLGTKRGVGTRIAWRGWHDVWRASRRLLVVAPLSFVIWFLADQASLIETDNIELRLTILHEPSLQVDVRSPQPAAFSASFRGPTRAIDALRSAVREKPLLLEWRLGDSYQRAGEYDLAAGELLSQLPAIARRGVTITRIAPEQVRIAVDQVVTVPMPVRVDTGSVRVGETRINPAQAQVSLRASDLERLPTDDRVVTASLGERLAQATPDRTYNFERVLLTARIGSITALRVQPDEIDVVLRVLGQTERTRISGVLVTVHASPELLSRYTFVPVDQNEWLIDIDVEGERSRLDALRPQDVLAFVNVTTQQIAAAGNAPLTTEVSFRLPESVRLVGRPPAVQYRMQPREELSP